MRRREFIAGTAGAAAMSVAHPAFAQAAALPGIKRIAIFHPTENPDSLSFKTLGAYSAFFVQMERLGYAEGKNIIVEGYSGFGRPDHYGEVARAIVASRPDLIISISGTLTRVLKPLTTTIPILAATADPIVGGIVTNLAKPEGNITGISADAGLETFGKRYQLLRDTVGKLTNVRLLIPASSIPLWEKGIAPVLRQADFLITAAVIAGKLDREAYEHVFDAMQAEAVNGLMVGDAPELVTDRQVLVSLAAKYRLPAIYPYREYVESGGLLSYGIDRAEIFRRLANMMDQVLRGASPSNIPYQQQTKFELVLNRKAAISLALEFPPTLLAAADQVIE
jgi:putative tryptophan/tyrosine transport system substrate-binding protein